jgi:hypothetical protein
MSLIGLKEISIAERHNLECKKYTLSKHSVTISKVVNIIYWYIILYCIIDDSGHAVA